MEQQLQQGNWPSYLFGQSQTTGTTATIQYTTQSLNHSLTHHVFLHQNQVNNNNHPRTLRHSINTQHNLNPHKPQSKSDIQSQAQTQVEFKFL